MILQKFQCPAVFRIEIQLIYIHLSAINGNPIGPVLRCEPKGTNRFLLLNRREIRCVGIVSQRLNQVMDFLLRQIRCRPRAFRDLPRTDFNAFNRGRIHKIGRIIILPPGRIRRKHVLCLPECLIRHLILPVYNAAVFHMEHDTDIWNILCLPCLFRIFHALFRQRIDGHKISSLRFLQHGYGILTHIPIAVLTENTDSVTAWDH